jgi:Short C-terminal domain
MAARTAVVAGTATAVSGRVSRRQANKYASQDAANEQQQAAAVQQGMEQSAAPAETDVATQIEELGKLKDQGLLTEEEFTAKKKQILGI